MSGSEKSWKRGKKNHQYWSWWGRDGTGRAFGVHGMGAAGFFVPSSGEQVDPRARAGISAALQPRSPGLRRTSRARGRSSWPGRRHRHHGGGKVTSGGGYPGEKRGGSARGRMVLLPREPKGVKIKLKEIGVEFGGASSVWDGGKVWHIPSPKGPSTAPSTRPQPQIKTLNDFLILKRPSLGDTAFLG